jgi:hypothetical protein
MDVREQRKIRATATLLHCYGTSAGAETVLVHQGTCGER